jgi:hypothetical protein
MIIERQSGLHQTRRQTAMDAGCTNFNLSKSDSIPWQTLYQSDIRRATTIRHVSRTSSSVIPTKQKRAGYEGFDCSIKPNHGLALSIYYTSLTPTTMSEEETTTTAPCAEGECTEGQACPEAEAPVAE